VLKRKVIGGVYKSSTALTLEEEVTRVGGNGHGKERGNG